MFPQHEQHQDPFDARQLFGLLTAIVFVWATAIEVFTRYRLGARCPGGYGAAVLLLVPIYSLFWEGYDIRPMFHFLMAFLAMVAWHRVTGLIRRWKHGDQEHSYYSGIPRLMWLLPKWDEFILKTWVEPLVVITIGAGIGLLGNDPLAVFVVIGGVCICVSMLASHWLLQQRAIDLNDQIVEQRHALKRFRSREV